jgi:hypothetical protein
MKEMFKNLQRTGFNREKYSPYQVQHKLDMEGWYDNTSILDLKTKNGFMVIFIDIHRIKLVYVRSQWEDTTILTTGCFSIMLHIK